MTASIVVETGSGLSTANAYQTAADADAIIEELYLIMGLSAAPSGLSDIHCIAGTWFLEGMFGRSFKGVKSSETQALSFPRVGCRDSSGYEYDSDELPSPLLKAHALASYYASTEGSSMIPNQSNPGAIKRKSVSAGPVSKEIEYVGGMESQKYYSLLDSFISELTRDGSIIVRG